MSDPHVDATWSLSPYSTISFVPEIVYQMCMHDRISETGVSTLYPLLRQFA